MPRSILLMFPPRSFTLLANSTLVACANFRDEPIVRLMRLKTTREGDLVDLFALKNTVKRLCSYTVLECRDDPVDCECAASCPSARFFEYEGIGLEWCCRPLPRSIVAFFLRTRSIKWKVWLVKYGVTSNWRMGGAERLVKWWIVRGI